MSYAALELSFSSFFLDVHSLFSLMFLFLHPLAERMSNERDHD